jgi:serine/threonine-protein kinase
LERQITEVNPLSSTLIELPPESLRDLEDDRAGYIEAASEAELTQAHKLGASVLGRVLYKGSRFGDYHILGFVAAGGMGEIYAAERIDPSGARRIPVALKLLQGNDTATLLRQITREAEICRSVHSKHVIRIYEYGLAENGHCFMAMELLRGEELFDRMRRYKMFPLRELGEICLQVLDGLRDIHRAGIVHRDIKPENSSLSRSKKWGDLAKLLDFGIARVMDQPDDPSMEVAGQIYGTPQYLAPEQGMSPEVDARADLYSLGIVMYECAAGCTPFERETPYVTMLAHQQDPVPLLPSTLDPEFCEIIYKALAKNPADRWQSAEEFIQILYRWLEETSWVDEVPGGDTPFTGQPAARDSGQLTSPRATPTHGQVSAKGTPIGLPGLTRGPAASGLHDSGIVPGRAPASFAAPQPEAPIELDRSTPARPVRAVAPRTTAQRPDAPAKQGSGVASAVTALVVLLVIAAAGFAIWKKRQAPAAQAAPTITAPAPSQGLSPSLSDTP